MRKKEAWMKLGAVVIAYGKTGTITSMREGNIDGVDYVYYISVKLNGSTHEGLYHPRDISEPVKEAQS